MSSWISVINKLPPENQLVDVKTTFNFIWEEVNLINGEWLDKDGVIDHVEFWKIHEDLNA